jgi:serine/threonine-protein kinase
MIASYRLGPVLGRGTQGEVYEALDTRTGLVVALKLLHGGRWSAVEMKVCARLEHPHIVRILEIGEHDGLQYIAMERMIGSLAEDAHRQRYLDSPDAAAGLVAKIAEAVHYHHQEGILHRDLKPANILFDSIGEPKLADFGVAKLVDESDHGTIAGTRPYMAAEQLDGHTTVRSDIYGLGVILYELLTGQRPFRAADTAELVREIREVPARDPCKLRPELDVDLTRICLRCLEKAPEDRYGSAEALESALVRHLNGELPEGASRRLRLWRWCLRNSATAGLIAATLTFLLILVPTVLSLAHEHASIRRAQAMQVNTSSAAMVAGTVLSQIRALSDAVALSARDDELVAAVQEGDTAVQQRLCEAFYRHYEDPAQRLKLTDNSPFNTWFVLDATGRLTAQYGKETEVPIIGRDFAWRDYFQGAWELGEAGLDATYVSSVFQSELDGYHKFAISTPIYGDDGEPIGVLVGAVPTAANLGSLVRHDLQNITALVGPRDHEREDQPDGSHWILVHPDYVEGEADPLTNPQVELLERASRGALRVEQSLGLPAPSLVQSSDDYRDPTATRHPKYAGRWLAGFAPVGNTGLVVVVQTEYDLPPRFETQFGRQLALWAVLSAAPGALLMLFAAWHRRRRSARRAA